MIKNDHTSPYHLQHAQTYNIYRYVHNRLYRGESCANGIDDDDVGGWLVAFWRGFSPTLDENMHFLLSARARVCFAYLIVGLFLCVCVCGALFVP